MFAEIDGFLYRGVYRTFQTLESLSFESGLRKPYKALVLEMEPYEIKKKPFHQATIFLLLTHKFFLSCDDIF